MRSTAEVGKARTVHRILEDRAVASGDRIALAIKEAGTWREISYADLSRRVRRVSGFLVSRSIRGGDRVALLSESRPEWAMVFLGAARNGATVVPLDPKLSPGELAPILGDCRPRLLFVSPRHASVAVELSRTQPSIEEVLLLHDDPQHSGLRSLDRLTTSPEAPTLMESEPRFGDCAVIAYTSGTTGRPKGVQISYESLAFQADCFEREFGMGEDDVLLSMLPLNHMLELTCGLLSPLHAGAQVCYCESLLPAEVSLAMRERRATRMLTVPLFLRALQRGIESQVERSGGWNARSFEFFRSLARGFLPRRLRRLLFARIHAGFGGRLTTFHSGGAPLDPNVAAFFANLGFDVFEGYGMTESSPVIATNTPDGKRAGSVGRALPGTQVRIARTAGEAEGEILVAGPHVMIGYFEQEALTREAIDAEGWLHTGDLGRQDPDGFLYVTGRLKTLIVLASGKKVQPEEIEAVLAASPNVKEVVVIGRIASAGSKGPGTRGEEVQAVAVPSDFLRRSVGEDLADLRTRIEEDFGRRLQAVAAFKRPARIHVLTRDLPKTTTGKVRRREVVRILDTEGAS